MNKIIKNYVDKIFIEFEQTNKNFRIIKRFLKNNFNFFIPNYIINDIVENETYCHFKALVDLAVANSELSRINGKKLKEGIKKIFKIESETSFLDSNLIIDNFNFFDNWWREYHFNAYINLKNYLNSKDIKLLKCFNVFIENKLYTKYEIELIKIGLLKYYININEMSAEELQSVKKLPKNITRKQFNKILKKIEKIK